MYLINDFPLHSISPVMRASGSYRLLLNTHLWAQMKCDRANQKSIRITAQTGSDGKISVFLIMVGWRINGKQWLRELAIPNQMSMIASKVLLRVILQPFYIVDCSLYTCA